MTFDELLTKYRASKSLPSEFNNPVLVLVGGATKAAETLEFRTRAVQGDAAMEIAMRLASAGMRDPRTDPSAVAAFTEVYPVTKRPGAAFPERVGIGRTRVVDVSVRVEGVSKYHAYVSQGEDGSYRVTDAGSTNGTRVAGKALAGGGTAAIDDWSVIGVGDAQLVFFTPATFKTLVANLAQPLGM